MENNKVNSNEDNDDETKDIESILQNNQVRDRLKEKEEEDSDYSSSTVPAEE